MVPCVRRASVDFSVTLPMEVRKGGLQYSALSASVSAVFISFGEHDSLNSFWIGFHFERHSVRNDTASLQPQNCYEMLSTETLLSKYWFLHFVSITVVKWND